MFARYQRFDAVGTGHRAREQYHTAHLAEICQLPHRLGEMRCQVFTDQPHGAAAQLVQPLALRAAEQLTLGDRSLQVQAARRHERLARHGTIREKEHRCQRHFRLRRHATQVQQRHHAAIHLLRFPLDRRGRQKRCLLGRLALEPRRCSRHRPRARIEEQATQFQALDQVIGDRWRHQVFAPRCPRDSLGLALQRDFTQLMRHVQIVRQLRHVVLGQ